MSRRTSTNAAESGGVVVDGKHGKAYGEQGFRHFLDVERARADRSGRPLRLLVVTLVSEDGTQAHIPRPAAVGIFEGLWKTLRETDLVGWYEEGRTVGAALAERGVADPETATAIQRRVIDAVRSQVPPRFVAPLRVRVVELAPRATGDRTDV